MNSNTLCVLNTWLLEIGSFLGAPLMISHGTMVGNHCSSARFTTNAFRAHYVAKFNHTSESKSNIFLRSVVAAPPLPVGCCPQWVLVKVMGSCTGRRGKASGSGDADWMELSTESRWVFTRKCGRFCRNATACPSMATSYPRPPQER